MKFAVALLSLMAASAAASDLTARIPPPEMCADLTGAPCGPNLGKCCFGTKCVKFGGAGRCVPKETEAAAKRAEPADCKFFLCQRAEPVQIVKRAAKEASVAACKFFLCPKWLTE